MEKKPDYRKENAEVLELLLLAKPTGQTIYWEDGTPLPVKGCKTAFNKNRDRKISKTIT